MSCMQMPPETHATATAKFMGRILPRQAGLEGEQDAGQSTAVVKARTSSLGRRLIKAGSVAIVHQEQVVWLFLLVATCYAVLLSLTVVPSLIAHPPEYCAVRVLTA